MNSFVTANPACTWDMQGALATIKTNASAPTLFFHNTDDYYKDSNQNPQGLYATQATLMKSSLDAVGTPTATLVDYGSGHVVPQTESTLQIMYDFLTSHIPTPVITGIDYSIVSPTHPSSTATFNMMGLKVAPNYKGLVIRNGRKLVVK